MATLRAILASLGGTGAVANVLSVLEQQQRDERAAARLEASLRPMAPATDVGQPVAA